MRIIRTAGISSAAPRRYAPSVAASAAVVSLSTRRARKSGCRRTRLTNSFFPAIIPACGPPSSLSPLNITIETPASTLCRTVGSVIPALERSTRQAERDEFFHRRLFREAGNREVRRMHAQQQPRVLIDRVFVIDYVRAIRSPDFSKHRSALRHDLRDAEAVADFNQFAPRDDYLSAFRQRR